MTRLGRPLDTSVEAEGVQLEAYRRMSTEQRFQIASELGTMCRELQRTGIRERHPDYTEDEVVIAHARLVLGDHLFPRVHPNKHHIVP